MIAMIDAEGYLERDSTKNIGGSYLKGIINSFSDRKGLLARN